MGVLYDREQIVGPCGIEGHECVGKNSLGRSGTIRWFSRWTGERSQLSQLSCRTQLNRPVSWQRRSLTFRVFRNSRSSGKRLALTSPTRVSAFAARLRTSPCRHHPWTENSTYGWSTATRIGPGCWASACATARSSLRQNWPGPATAFGRSIMTGFCTMRGDTGGIANWGR